MGRIPVLRERMILPTLLEKEGYGIRISGLRLSSSLICPMNSVMSRRIFWVFILILLGLLARRAFLSPLEPGEAETIRQANNFGEWLTLVFNEPSRAWTQNSLELYWNDQEQHPSVPKIFMWIPLMVMGDRTGEATACRLGALLFIIPAAWALKQLAGTAKGLSVGYFGALFALLSPNVLHHADLATVYFPYTALWWMAVLVWLRREDIRLGRTLFCILFAILFGTKVSALHLLAILAIWQFLERRTIHRLRQWILPAIAGIAVYLLIWPWLWPMPLTRLWHHVGIHSHPASNIFPSTFTPQVMFWYLIPIVALLLGTPLHHIILAWYGWNKTDDEQIQKTPEVDGKPGAGRLSMLMLLTALLPPLLIPIAISGETEASRYILVSYMAVGYMAGWGAEQIMRKWRNPAVCVLILSLYLVTMVVLSRPIFRPNLAGRYIIQMEAEHSEPSG